MVKRSKIILFEKSKSLAAAWSVLYLAIALCIVFPLVLVFLTPTAKDFSEVIFSESWRQSLLNTIFSTLASTSSAVIIGYIYAYAIVYGEIPFKSFFAAIPILHLITPPFVGGLSFILLLGRRGFITHSLLHLNLTLYGFPALLIAQSLCFFPLAYMICAQVLRSVNHSLELAAYGMGASGKRIFWTVTLPLSFSGIVASFLFIAVAVMSDFGNPMIVAGRYRVLAVEIYTQLTGWLNAGKSAVLGLSLVLPSLALFFLQNKITKKNMIRLSAVGGKSFSVSGKKRSFVTKILLTAFCAFISLAVLSQFAAIIAGSFQTLWGVKTDFTLAHVRTLLNCTKEIKNSLTLSLEGAAFSTIFAAVAAYLVYRTKCPLKKLLDTLIQIPAAVPGSLFGLAFSLSASKTGFHNSRVLIVIAIAVGFIPFSYRICAATFAQIKSNLDDAARTAGANRLRVLTDIIIPLANSAAIDSFIYDFVRGVGTMSAVIFLVSFDTPLTSIKILNLAAQGLWGQSAALAMLLTVITFAIIGAGKAALFLWRKNKKW